MYLSKNQPKIDFAVIKLLYRAKRVNVINQTMKRKLNKFKNDEETKIFGQLVLNSFGSVYTVS